VLAQSPNVTYSMEILIATLDLMGQKKNTNWSTYLLTRYIALQTNSTYNCVYGRGFPVNSPGTGRRYSITNTPSSLYTPSSSKFICRFQKIVLRISARKKLEKKRSRILLTACTGWSRDRSGWSTWRVQLARGRASCGAAELGTTSGQPGTRDTWVYLQ